MCRDPEPCSCRLARSGLGENQQLTSVPSVLLRLMAGASVIVGHLEGGNDHHNTARPSSLGLRVTQLLCPVLPC